MMRYRLLFSLVGLILALGFSSTAMAGQVLTDCEITINKVQSFGAGAGQLRNTSTVCGQTGGNTKAKSVTVVAGLVDGANGTCPSSESREVTVELVQAGTNLIGGTDPQISGPQALIKMILSGGSTGRFKFTAGYNQTSCKGGAGPVAKSRDGVNQLNDPAFQWQVIATKISDSDTSNRTEDSSNTAPLLCKPCRTE